jgi:hypothetical protein
MRKFMLKMDMLSFFSARRRKYYAYKSIEGIG